LSKSIRSLAALLLKNSNNRISSSDNQSSSLIGFNSSRNYLLFRCKSATRGRAAQSTIWIRIFCLAFVTASLPFPTPTLKYERESERGVLLISARLLLSTLPIQSGIITGLDLDESTTRMLGTKHPKLDILSDGGATAAVISSCFVLLDSPVSVRGKYTENYHLL